MITTPTVQWSALAPDLILLGGAALLLLAAVFVPGRLARDVAAVVGCGCFVAAVVAVVVTWDYGGGDWLVVAQQLRVDRLGNATRVVIAAAGLTTVISSFGWARIESRACEYVALILIAASGMDLLAVSHSFVSLFVALELFSLSLYTLCAIDPASRSGLESAFKYLVLGSVGSAVLVYGSALLYGATGTFRFDAVGKALAAGGADSRLALAGTAMVIAGLAFKTALVPFHMWTPDVYEGAPTPITGFMAAATKAAAFVVFFRVVTEALPAQVDYWRPALATLAIASMVGGNVVALVQTNVKRMLAYSSIGHAGYLLMAIAAADSLATRALLYYLAVYSAMTLGSFAVVTVRERETGAPVTIESLRGWGFSRPFFGAAFAICLLSLAGFPPTGGFLAKLYVFGAAVDADLSYLAIVGAITTVVSLGYYLRVGMALYDRRAESRALAPGVPGLATAGFAAALGVAVVLWLGIYPGEATDWFAQAASALGARR